MVLLSEMPVAAHLLIKHQKERACFFPSAAAAIGSTSVQLSCFQVEHFCTTPNEGLFICSRLSVFSKSRTLKAAICFERSAAELEGVGGREVKALGL